MTWVISIEYRDNPEETKLTYTMAHILLDDFRELLMNPAIKSIRISLKP